MNEKKKNKKQKGIRWWPLVALIICDGVATLALIVVEQSSRQSLIMNVFMVQFLTLAGVFIWGLFLSRTSLKWRMCFLVICLAIPVLMASLFRIKEVSGDIMPILTWRWAQDRVPVAADGVSTGSKPTGVVAVEDFPQFLGSQRVAKVGDHAINLDWEQHPPQLMWQRDVGPSWSGFAVVGPRVFTQEQVGDQESVVCYDLGEGTELWRIAYPGRYETTMGGVGPRATPTVHEGTVYSVGALGELTALSVEDGSLQWTAKAAGDVPNEWGMSCSPLIVDDMVVVNAGGEGRALIAFDRLTGHQRWRGGNADAGYSSPILANLAGVPQIISFCQSKVMAVDPTNGLVLWETVWPGAQPNVAQPIVVGDDKLLVSSGYGIGSKYYQISASQDGLKADLLWESRKLKAKFSNVVLKEGVIFGLDDGILVCLDLENGKRRWKKGRFGHGQMLLVKETLVITSEKGDLVLVDANPDQYVERARVHAMDGKMWNSPALAWPYLLVRNANQAQCYKLSEDGS